MVSICLSRGNTLRLNSGGADRGLRQLQCPRPPNGCARYEKRYIERWLEQGNLTCPVTGQTLTRPVALTPNVALRHSIEDWAQQHAIFLLVCPPADPAAGGQSQDALQTWSWQRNRHK